MTTSYRRPIVVGVDGTDAGRTAVRWAAGEARLRAAPLRIVTAYETASPAGPLPAPVSLRKDFDDAGTFAHELVPGRLGRVLLAESRAARLVVLGRRSGGPVAGLAVERVTTRVAAHATCSVAVVRRDPAGASSGRIAVGFDGSRAAVTALDFGLDEAEATGAPLEVVYCWEPEDYVSVMRESAEAARRARRRTPRRAFTGGRADRAIATRGTARRRLARTRRGHRPAPGVGQPGVAAPESMHGHRGKE
ncbi:MAG: universal stress protein [Streptosporangiales bacterium]|nr:universal stress protein [Streptosporangiales bacterium]